MEDDKNKNMNLPEENMPEELPSEDIIASEDGLPTAEDGIELT